MRNPLVSIVIPAYNAAKYIGETLESVRAQTFRDYEIIVVDDGSRDNSIGVAARFGGVICTRQSNRGAAAARNIGIHLARGKYVAFLDADDLWLPRKLEKQMAYCEANPGTQWIYSDGLVFDSYTDRIVCRIGNRVQLHQGDVLHPLLLRSFIPSATPVVKRDALYETGLFNESPDRRMAEDWCLWLRLARRHPLALIDEPLARIRLHGENSSRMASPATLYRNRRGLLADTIASNPRIPASVARCALSGVSLSAGMRHLRRREFGGASRMFLEAMKLRYHAGSI